MIVPENKGWLLKPTPTGWLLKPYRHWGTKKRIKNSNSNNNSYNNNSRNNRNNNNREVGEKSIRSAINPSTSFIAGTWSRLYSDA